MSRILTVLAILLGMAAHAQQQVLVLVGDTALPRKWGGPFTVGKTEVDSRTAQLRGEMIASGYLAASRDSCVHGPDTTPSTTKAVFATATLHPTEDLSITGGLRYTKDKKDYTYFRRNPDGTIPNGGIGMAPGTPCAASGMPTPATKLSTSGPTSPA